MRCTGYARRAIAGALALPCDRERTKATPAKKAERTERLSRVWP